MTSSTVFTPLISELSSSPLEYRVLQSDEAERLYQQYPDLPHDSEEGCPTCDKKGAFVYKGELVECNCQDQLSRHKHYWNSGIGKAYQILDWEDFYGDTQALDAAELYLSKHSEFVKRGVGLIFHGEFGLGKTLLSQLVLKELVMRGYSSFFTTFSDTVDLFTAGWRSETERQWYQRKIRDTFVLVLDDVGREFKTKNALSEATFDAILRGRARDGKVTILTTNKHIEELKQEYGGAVLSLLQENSIVHEFTGIDYRPLAQRRALDEIKRGWERPIF